MFLTIMLNSSEYKPFQKDIPKFDKYPTHSHVETDNKVSKFMKFKNICCFHHLNVKLAS